MSVEVVPTCSVGRVPARWMGAHPALPGSSGACAGSPWHFALTPARLPGCGCSAGSAPRSEGPLSSWWVRMWRRFPLATEQIVDCDVGLICSEIELPAQVPWGEGKLVGQRRPVERTSGSSGSRHRGGSGRQRTSRGSRFAWFVRQLGCVPPSANVGRLSAHKKVAECRDATGRAWRLSANGCPAMNADSQSASSGPTTVAARESFRARLVLLRPAVSCLCQPLRGLGRVRSGARPCPAARLGRAN